MPHKINAKTYYQLLQVAPNATAKEIEKAVDRMIEYACETYPGDDGRDRVHRDSIIFVVQEAAGRLLSADSRKEYNAGSLSPTTEYNVHYLLTPPLRDERLEGLELTDKEKQLLNEFDRHTYLRWMACNPEHPDFACLSPNRQEVADILTFSVKAFNRYREIHPNEEIDFSYKDFVGANLQGANLEGAILIGTNFSGANLQGANLKECVFADVNFSKADLRGVDMTGAIGDPERLPLLRGAIIDESNNLGHLMNEAYKRDTPLKKEPQIG